MLTLGQRIRLRSFQGLPSTPPGRDKPGENYWLLIGRTGIVRDDDDTPLRQVPGGPRVLVRFDDDVSALGLHCHNPEPNTLWIQVSDLALADD